MQNYYKILAAVIPFFQISLVSYASETDIERCRRTTQDPDAFHLKTLLTQGPSGDEQVTLCGTAKGGDGLGGDAKGNRYNRVFIRSMANAPEQTLKVYTLHHHEVIRKQTAGGMRFLAVATTDNARTIADSLFFMFEKNETTTEHGVFTLSYLDDQNFVRHAVLGSKLL